MEANLSEIRNAFFDLLVQMSDETPQEELKTLVDLFFKEAETKYSMEELAEKFDSVEAVLDSYRKFLRSQKW